MRAAEDVRGAESVQLPQQEVVIDATSPGDARLVLRPRRESEDLNSYMSLAANLAMAALMLESKVGLFRVMAEPSSAALGAIRRAARALGVRWPDSMTLRQLAPTLDLTNPVHADILLSARRAGGRASYATYDPLTRPWHSALGATYAHGTAPMRRLADRYVLDLVGDLVAGRKASTDAIARLDRLPATMERADSVAAKVDRAVIDLVEAVSMVDRVGETFDAEVVDTDHNGATVQVLDPAVRARVAKAGSVVGQRIRVVLVEADPTKRLIRLRPL